VKCEAAAIRAESDITNAHGDCGELLQIASGRWHRVNVGCLQFVIWLVDTPGDEVNARAVMAPERLGFVELSGGELFRLCELVGCGRHIEHPNVIVAFRIKIAFVVVAVDRAVDNVYVGFVFAFRLRRFWLCGVLGGFGFL